MMQYCVYFVTTVAPIYCPGMSSEMYVEIMSSISTCLAQFEEAVGPYVCVVISVRTWLCLCSV